MSGILAVWNDRDPEIADVYESWYLHEHLPERVGVPGFLDGRRFEAIASDRAFFTFYRLTDAAVLTSTAYRERLADPTPGTRRIMAHWRGMIRASCTVERTRGHLDGAYLVSLRWEAPGLASDLDGLADKLAALPGFCRLGLWRDSGSGSSRGTAEGDTRREPDAGIAGALTAEFCRERDLDAAVALFGSDPALGALAPRTGLYRFLCGLTAEALARP
jgi:hypothetical protein